MGKITGFLELDRVDRDYAPVEERLKTYNEFVIPLGDKDVQQLSLIEKRRDSTLSERAVMAVRFTRLETAG